MDKKTEINQLTGIFSGGHPGTIYSANHDFVEHLVIGQSGKATTLLDKILPADQQALQAWVEQQTPSENGSIDVMSWPGWGAAVQAKILSKTDRKSNP